MNTPNAPPGYGSEVPEIILKVFIYNFNEFVISSIIKLYDTSRVQFCKASQRASLQNVTFPLNINNYIIVYCTLLRYIAYYMTTQQQNRSAEAASLQKYKLITLLKLLMLSQKLLQLQIKSILGQNTSGVERL